jgi:hypothetical protein
LFDRLQFRDLARHLFLPRSELGDAADYLLGGDPVGLRTPPSAAPGITRLLRRSALSVG